MNQYQKYLRKANKIVDTLKVNASKNMCENYGQKEIQPLLNELNGLHSGLTYQEQCGIKAVLSSVSDITI